MPFETHMAARRSYPIRQSSLDATGRLSLRRRDLAGLHQLLEPTQVFANGLVRLLAEQLRDGRTEPAARRVVLQVHDDARAVRVLVEVDRPRGCDRRALERLPADHLVRDLVDDARVPLDAHAGRSLRDP